jgi:hypothetical protein
MGWHRALQELSSSACGVAAIHSECVTDHEACARTAKPKHSGGDLLRPTKSTNRLVSHDVFHGVRFLANMSATIGVSIVPGQTALMRIPLEAYSSAALFVSPITPCLDA